MKMDKVLKLSDSTGSIRLRRIYAMHGMQEEFTKRIMKKDWSGFDDDEEDAVMNELDNIHAEVHNEYE